MLQSIVYKEYIKTYKLILLFICIIIVSIFSTFLNAKNAFIYNEATNVILKVSIMGIFSFNYLDYILPIFAIMLAVMQFYLEVSNARIRLYLHLPMTTFRLVSILIFIGLIFLIIIFLIITFLYFFILKFYYPYEIFLAIMTKLYPIYLMSLLCYVGTILVFIEPLYKRKILYIMITYFIIKYYNEYIDKYFLSEMLDNFILFIIGIYILLIYDVFDSYVKGYVK